MPTSLLKLDPLHTIYLQGFDDFGAAASLWGTSATGFSLSGVFRDQADFAVFVLFNRDDYYGHPSFQYLPDGNFAGIILDYDIEWTGIQPFESKKSPFTDWPYLNFLMTDGTSHQVLLSSLGTPPGGRTGASGTITLTTSSAVLAFDRVTLWYQNLAFDYIAAGGETLAAIATNLAAQINAVNYIANGPVVLSAAAVGAVITITAEAGSDGNMVTFYALSKNTRLAATPTPVQLSGGTSDSLLWHITVAFSVLGYTNIQKLWLTFAPSLANGTAYPSTEWAVTVTNWAVTDGSGTRPLKVAGPGSVRIEENSEWCTYAGFFEDVPYVTFGFFSQGQAKRAAATGANVTVETHCASTHNIYVGTFLNFDCGILSASLDDGAPVTLDCYIAVNNRAKVRRLLFSGVAAGQHSVVLTVTGTKNASSAGYYLYLDFLECAILSDVPDPVSLGMGAATDYDTLHTYNLSPQRVLWNLQQLGQAEEVNHYCGVFYWNQRQAVGRVYPVATATFGGTWAGGDSVFLTFGATTIGKSVFPADNSTTIAAHFAYFINEVFTGIWAVAVGPVLTITTRSTGPNWLFAFSTSFTSILGTVTPAGSLNSGEAEGVWTIDSAVTPVLNRAFHDWNADWFVTLQAAGVGVVAAFSNELVNTEDNPGAGQVWVARYPNGNPVQTDTGVGTLHSDHCAFSVPFQAYLQTAYIEMAALMNAAGLPIRLQHGERLWWYFANSSGMAYYDADTAAAALIALGRPLHTFLTPNDSPAVNAFADASFLRSRLETFVNDVNTAILAAYPAALFELLFPLDVNDPDTRQLNRYVNLPLSWQTRAGSPFDTLMMEAFQFGGIDHNVNKAKRAAAYPFDELSWDRTYCRYLLGLFYPGWPWWRELRVARLTQVPLIKTWAYDHVCLFGWDLAFPAKASSIL